MTTIKDYVFEATEAARLSGHALVTTGHLFAAIVKLPSQLQPLWEKYQLTYPKALAALYEQMPPTLDLPFQPEAKVPLSPNVLGVLDSRTTESVCDLLYCLLLVSAARRTTMLAMLERLGVIRTVLASDVYEIGNHWPHRTRLSLAKQKPAGSYVGAVSITTASSDTTFDPFPNPGIMTNASNLLRRLAGELPALRRLAAIKQIMVHKMDPESEERYLNLISTGARKEAEYLGKVADDLIEGVSKLHGFWDRYNTVPAKKSGPAVDIESLAVDTGSIQGYADMREWVLAHMGKAHEEKAPEEQVAKQEAEYVLHQKDQPGHLCSEDKKKFKPPYMPDVVLPHSAMATEDLEESQDSCDPTKDECPRGHHKLEGECRREYCSCSCARCNEQCDKNFH